jgi:predicted  nucleic acid-binding Zn-ribbon protein
MADKRETLTARMTRIEEKHEELADMVKMLMAAQIKTEEQFRETDKRIPTMVSAIGELIGRTPPQGPASRP